MIKATFITVLLVCTSGIFLIAQKNTFKSFCATPSEKISWLDSLQRAPQLQLRETELIYLPVAVHLVENDQGVNSIPESKILEAFCTLNEHFKPVNIQFFLQYPILYLRNTAFYDHADAATALQMIQSARIPGVINTFFVKNAADACGYTLRNQSGLALGIALSADCTGGNTSAWAHEMGHVLSLPHTFHGWENYPYNYELPAPASVGRTAVERVDRSNCRAAGDGFCDTDPDYLNGRWTCNQDTLSDILQKDPLGVAFRSDGSNLMSYSADPCGARFSAEQQSAMRLYVQQNLSGISSKGLTVPALSRSDIVLVEPRMKEVLSNPDSVTFSWQPVSGIAGWVLEVSPIPSFTILNYSTVTTANSLSIALAPGRTYFWRVWAFNQFSTCKYVSGTGTFSLASVTATAERNPPNPVNAYPNPIRASAEPLTFSFESLQAANSRLLLHDALGRVHWSASWDIQPGMNTLDIPVARLAPGTYFVRLVVGQEVILHKVVIQPAS